MRDSPSWYPNSAFQATRPGDLTTSIHAYRSAVQRPRSAAGAAGRLERIVGRQP